MSVALSTLAPGEHGRVCGFADENDAAVHLMQMGVVEGADITVIRTAPGGDPMEVDVMGYALSLRRAEAATVLVQAGNPE